MTGTHANSRSAVAMSVGDRASAIARLDGTHWEVVIIGAGVAGTIAAIQLARAGHRVLLVEAKSFPRDKVCGGCLNQRAWMSMLQLTLETDSIRGLSLDLGKSILAAGAVPLDRLRLKCMDRDASWPMPTMYAISRRALDSLLVDAAIGSGAVFHTEVMAKVINEDARQVRCVRLQARDGSSVTVQTGVVIAADGLGHPSLSEIEAVRSEAISDARIGLGASFNDDSSLVPSGELTMAVGRFGYVGLTRVEDGLLNVAAAIHRSALKRSASAAACIAELLTQCHLEVPAGLLDAKWSGTMPLTRTSSSVAAKRLLLIGDAANYVEPFTGEGMSWAIQSARLASRLLIEHNCQWSDRVSDLWCLQWRQNIRREQWTCRAMAGLLRHPKLARVSLGIARRMPWIARWIIHRTNGSQPHYKCIGTT